MKEHQNSDNHESLDKEFRLYAAKRIAAGILITVFLLCMFGFVFHYFGNTPLEEDHAALNEQDETGTHDDETSLDHVSPHQDTERADPYDMHPTQDSHKTTGVRHGYDHGTDVTHSDKSTDTVKGVALVSALITLMEDQLDGYGWRPNDFIKFTDNVNNFQKGVRNVVWHATEKLSDDIARPGISAELDKNLERARGYFGQPIEQFVLPSAESNYGNGIKELKKYKERLLSGEAYFYTRSDNLIPLLKELQKHLGSCDDKLVKNTEEDGEPVSFFKADNYFYEAQGVAHSILVILEAIEKDFSGIIETRNCQYDLHHAIKSCREATEISPTIILNNDLDSIFANHRANIASHISHARFYIAVLIKALST